MDFIIIKISTQADLKWDFRLRFPSRLTGP